MIAMNEAVIILVAPQMGENIGATARAMKNFGLADLRIVAPRDGWPNEKADNMSVGAIDIIHNAIVYNDLSAAIADLEYVYATTSVPRDMNKEYVTSKNIAQEPAVQDCKFGIMFGRESSGLNNDEIMLANKILTINTTDFNSLNIAHAVAVICHEIFKSNTEQHSPNLQDLATKNEVTLFLNHLEEELDNKNFFKSLDKKPRMMRNITNIFTRIDRLSNAEIQTLRGILKSLSN
jgi:tRNA/rRNA methyltransferase